ncbi:hypothetical protein COT63_01220 [Candidatus Shapirobacteria bacterium CG09_land_8_20_14_0_10_38_17]|uniref:Uncharacterized protein n=1 Tax=Candidatus Shapirobacteria bacterium CG09_land_8_20_14_0_10_38_17 TaxID=1974884 RepID=A0A2H0WR96_9BACT|nr:MAG: hypothetical protein COT63_01220 [Candidatus Shapirobacteria bacterium CG09_land_8_20_14_0_10_38_17]
MPAKKREISLLLEEKKGFPGTIERITEWLINIGRWIIVFTELIVILSFLSRFWLDQRVANLYDQTVQKIAIIEAAADFEKEFRSLNQRLDQTNTLQSQNQDQSEILENIIAILPPEISLKSIKINGDQGGVEFIILSPKESTFITLFQNLILTPLFSEVEIANVSTRTLGLETELSIKAKLALKQK